MKKFNALFVLTAVSLGVLYAGTPTPTPKPSPVETPCSYKLTVDIYNPRGKAAGTMSMSVLPGNTSAGPGRFDPENNLAHDSIFFADGETNKTLFFQPLCAGAYRVSYDKKSYTIYIPGTSYVRFDK
jgi:hypothetical protein